MGAHSHLAEASVGAIDEIEDVDVSLKGRCWPPVCRPIYRQTDLVKLDSILLH